ncbi:MAG: hypothetical protein NVS4B7_02070 [Ktedonobacteraceae bacterium]
MQLDNVRLLTGDDDTSIYSAGYELFISAADAETTEEAGQKRNEDDVEGGEGQARCAEG